jgi:hypothetical protein
MVSSICTDRYSANDLTKSHGSIQDVRMWCGIHTDLVLRCFVDPEGLNYKHLLVGMVPDLVSGLTV